MAQSRPILAEDFQGYLADEATLNSLGTALGNVAEESSRLVLRLQDLIEDDNGEVVLFNDSHVPSLALETGARMVAHGESQGHVTAAGEDVSGFQFISFDTGMTIYFKEGLDLILVSPET